MVSGTNRHWTFWVYHVIFAQARRLNLVRQCWRTRVYSFSCGRPATAMLMVSIWTTLVAVAVALGTGHAISAGVLIYRVLVAAVTCGVAIIAFGAALALRRVEREAERWAFALVPEDVAVRR